jgi:CheY-like chemotaxis protein
MVRQILAFSRNQAQERQVLKLEPVVRDALKLLRSMVPVTIHIEPHFDPECPAVLANVEQIHQVILNLGSNAAHAMRKNGGRLEIFQAPVSVDEALAAANPQLRRASYVRLTVRDTGHGMDSTTLDRIFDPFFTTKAPGEGTGLGLAIVHSIMRNHDGAISVSSEPGCGTVFELYFPAVAGIEVRSDADTTVLRKGKGQHVLVVDGDPALADSAKRLIERLGYRATACHSAADALDRFRADPKQFDCVLSDAAVPGLSGLELAAECHHFKPAIPVVLMSGSPSAIGIDSLRSLGIRDFILKPFPLQVLAETLHHSLAATKD